MTASVIAPESVARGELFEVTARIAHAMESGFRVGDDGEAIPRCILNRITCVYGGRVVFSAECNATMAADPEVTFYVVAEESGALEVQWREETGIVYTARAEIAVA
jgi:sulfur-oxidizing protein SoxZ